MRRRAPDLRKPGFILPTCTLAGFTWILLLLAALAGAASCALPGRAPEASFTVDLTQSEPGVARVLLEFEGRHGSHVTLSSFVQSPALRVESLLARQGRTELRVRRSRDERGFANWEIAAPPADGPIAVEYAVRPGAPEEVRMSGPTGYRFGHLDHRFGLLGGRQIFLLPTVPSKPRAIQVAFRLRDGQEVLTPWGAGDHALRFHIKGEDAAAELLEAVLAMGTFEIAKSLDGAFQVHALEDLPEELRRASLRRAMNLYGFLSEHLGRTRRPYQLILAPKAPEGMLISVPPGRGGMGLSLGEGLPTRWLSIGRALGRACLEDRSDRDAKRQEDPWIFEGLPVYLTLAFSERDSWRSRQDWLEQFYYESGALEMDLRKPDPAGGDVKREWRAALILDRLSRELQSQGKPPVEEICRKTLGAGKPLAWSRILQTSMPAEVRERLEKWLAPSPYPFPFPGSSQGAPPARLPSPPPLDRAHSGTGRIDLYLGARNFGLLEQCGCRSRQMGGMARRATLLRERLHDRMPAVSVELGDAIPFDPISPLLDAQKVVESDLSLALMAGAGTRASVAGYAELAYGPAFLAAREARLPGRIGIISANVRGAGLSFAPAYRVGTVRPALRIYGAVDASAYHLGRPLEFEDAIAGTSIESPGSALGKVVDDAAAGEILGVAGPIGPSEVLAIQAAVPEISLIITDDYFHFEQDPRLEFERPLGLGFSTFGMLGNTLVVLLKSDSYAMVRLGLALDPEKRIAGAGLEDLPLDETIPDDPGVRARLDDHYAALAEASGLSDHAPLGTSLREKLGASYVGVEACAACHREETLQWRSTPHASAFATLLSRRRQGVPGCTACHVTGSGQPDGYRGMADGALRNVQCESCHGPGSRHVAAPGKKSILRAPPARICVECHDPQHSDMTDGNFPLYWSRVLHSRGPADPP